MYIWMLWEAVPRPRLAGDKHRDSFEGKGQTDMISIFGWAQFNPFSAGVIATNLSSASEHGKKEAPRSFF
jgi:hypothetical protein